MNSHDRGSIDGHHPKYLTKLVNFLHVLLKIYLHLRGHPFLPVNDLHYNSVKTTCHDEKNNVSVPLFGQVTDER
jgi:hypothetical protein